MSAFANTFPAGRGVVGAFAPTGEPFIVLQEAGFQSLDGAETGARQAFDGYAGSHSGALYWRVPPETAIHGRVPPRKGGINTYAFYMRLLISDKEVMP